MKKLLKCSICGKYTLSSLHCGKQTISPHPIASGVEKNIKERIKARISALEKEEMQGDVEFKDSIPY